MTHTYEITHDVQGKQGVFCPMCAQIRSPKSFRYPITLAQAEARGYYNHEERPMHATAKHCEYCRASGKTKGPNHIRPADLPKLKRDQLRIELTRGRLKEGMVQAELDRRDRLRPEIRREAGRLGGQRRWERHDDARWQWVHGLLNREIQMVLNKTSRTELAAMDPDDTNAQAQATFHREYLIVLRSARNRARVGLGDAKEGQYTWADLVGAEDVEHLLRLWQAIDHLSVRKRPGRPPSTPLLLARHATDIFEGCPITTRTMRVPAPKKTRDTTFDITPATQSAPFADWDS